VLKVGSEKEAISSDARLNAGAAIFIAGFFLFMATALVVSWQNSRLAGVFDLTYVLENAYRISLGQVPYRDFPLPHPPLTFLIQAALIKLTGIVYWHHIACCAFMGGGATPELAATNALCRAHSLHFESAS